MTRSEYFRFRTSSSGLTDDELLILDCLFDGKGYPPSALNDTNFLLRAYLPFSHGLSDKKVRALLAHWIKDGWLEYEEDRGPHYSLTPLGGAHWEQERKPPWDRYCYDCYYYAGVGPWCRRRKATQPLGVITSPSRKTAEAFFRRFKRYPLVYGEVVGRSKTIRIVPELGCVYWKTFPRAFEIRFAIRETEWRLPERNHFQNGIRWWRDVSDLVELRLKGVS